MTQHKEKKYAIIIDSSKCFDCKACMIACKVENEVPRGFWRNWVRTVNDQDGDLRTEFQPGQCMQCDDPSCVAACPVGATFKQKDGLVVIDKNKCIGCGNCVTACPYDARYRHPTRQVADKCDFCEHRLKQGEEPACVQTCPTRARVFGDLNDPSSKVSQLLKDEKLIRIPAPHINTKPNIYYHMGTNLLDWAREPKMPGNVHMPRSFWETS